MLRQNCKNRLALVEIVKKKKTWLVSIKKNDTKIV